MEQDKIDGAAYSIISFAGHALPASYQAAIFSKWLRSLRHGNEYFKLIVSDAYFSSYSKYIGSILQRPNTVVRLAVLSDDHDVLLGFAVHRDSVLDYCHVHVDQRRQGIGRALMPKNVHTITHLTNTGASIWSSKLPGVVFNPFA